LFAKENQTSEMICGVAAPAEDEEPKIFSERFESVKNLNPSLSAASLTTLDASSVLNKSLVAKKTYKKCPLHKKKKNTCRVCSPHMFCEHLRFKN
jgi:hypothetical protein